ncbi:hypothetical protein [Glaciecola sp. MF2-115]|uniref:hypothetical protein n=1 Tax=Glaciecola sp. MF2-115 TaxID=3384827 RepID=UPI0039A3ECDA
MALGSVLGLGQRKVNLIVNFDYVGMGSPSGEPFVDVFPVDADGFPDYINSPIDTLVTPAMVNQVPVHGRSTLLLLGFLALLGSRVQRLKNKTRS